MGFARLLALAVAILACVQVAWAGCVCKEGIIDLTSTPYQRCFCTENGVTVQSVRPAIFAQIETRGSVFVKWTGDFCHGSTNPVCTFTMPNKAVNINAEFNKKPMKPVWRRDG